MSRIQAFIFGAIIIFSAFSANAATWTVTKSTDGNDGACNADCSLREAVAVAATGDTVVFGQNLIGQSVQLFGSEISVFNRITIDGFLNASNVVSVSGGGMWKHFQVKTGGGLTLKNIVLRQGSNSESGSIGTEANADLILDRVSIHQNQGGDAGAVRLFGAGTHVITNSSIRGNVGTFAPAILISASSSLYMSNTTVSGNQNLVSDPDAWGTITSFSSGSVILRNCTINNNKARRGGGLYAAGGGTIDLGNTIIAQNTTDTTGADIFYASSLISSGGNLIGNTANVPAGIFTQTNDATGFNPLLATQLAGQGGYPVETHPLQAGSAARNTGLNALAVEPFSNTPLNTDARGAGFPRIFGGTVDKGAFEDQTDGDSLVVSKSANGNDGVCDTDCSLREAVGAAQADAGTDTITFAVFLNGNLNLGGAEIVVENQAVNIVGDTSNSARLTVSGGNTNRIFRVLNGTLNLSGLTLANGNGASPVNNNSGGAVYAYAGGNLSLDRVIVRNNTADFFGALFLTGGGATHRINNSTIHNNTANDCIGIGLGGGQLFMANATVSTNLDGDGGAGFGALCNLGAAMTIRNSTVSFNRIGTDAGGGIWTSGTLNLGNTIVSNNIAGSDADIHLDSGTITSAGGNLVQTVSGFPAGTFTQTNDLTAADPLLAALADNGGTIPTHLLQPGSPALNSGVNVLAVDPFDNSVLATDARGTGFMRIVSTVDKGAFETLIPTSANVSVGGRVTVKGFGLKKATVVLTDAMGVENTVLTDARGYFRFEEVEVGQTCIVSVVSKRFQFAPQVVSVMDEINDLNFYAEPQ